MLCSPGHIQNEPLLRVITPIETKRCITYQMRSSATAVMLLYQKGRSLHGNIRVMSSTHSVERYAATDDITMMMIVMIKNDGTAHKHSFNS